MSVIDSEFPDSNDPMQQQEIETSNRYDTPTPRKTTNPSQRQLDANRRNAQRSTGPRTVEGKRRIRYNALKHGMLSSKQVVIPGVEDPAEFDSLLEQLREDLHPVGKMEELLVHQIAVCQWRLRRALLCESGEIRQAKDDALYAIAGRRQTDVIAEAENRCDLDSKLQIAERSLAELIDSGDLTVESQVLLCSAFQEDGELQSLLSESDPASGNIEEKCLAITEILQAKIGCIRFAKRLRLNPEAQFAAASLPSRGSMERILRYENSIHRELYRAMNQLERLQLRRQGEIVPATINVDIGGDT